jgi:hypothetical protein
LKRGQLTQNSAASENRKSSSRRKPEEKTRRLFILGAGCSYAAGLPDGDRLAGQLFGYVGGAPWEVVYNRPPNNYWNPLSATLHQVLAEIADGGMQSRWALDRVFDRFHELMGRAPAAFGATYGLLFEATAQLLYTRSCYGATTEAYRKFVTALQPSDIVLTFNWDICPEIALYQTGRGFSRALSENAPTDIPWLLKLHGSIDYLIVDAGRKLKGGEGQASFLETLGAEPPSPFPGRSFVLTRLRTYDLGYEVTLDGTSKRDEKLSATSAVLGGYDVGPFILAHALDEYPTLHMLTPGSPRLLYDWQYHLTSQLLARVCAEIREVFVVGYSFPPYDKPVHRVLQGIHSLAHKPPTHIVNPAAAKLSPVLLKSIFGKYELHACGFGDYKWNYES